MAVADTRTLSGADFVQGRVIWRLRMLDVSTEIQCGRVVPSIPGMGLAAWRDMLQRYPHLAEMYPHYTSDDKELKKLAQSDARKVRRRAKRDEQARLAVEEMRQEEEREQVEYALTRKEEDERRARAKEEKLATVIVLKARGFNLAEIGGHFNVCRERANQLFRQGRWLARSSDRFLQFVIEFDKELPLSACQPVNSSQRHPA